MAIARLILQDFRNHAAATLDPGDGFVLLTGDNGAGKTNVLEALSLLAPGRGLRSAPLSDMAREGGGGGFAISARLDGNDLGTGTLPASPDRRTVRINGAAAPVNALGERLAIVWLTPAMDRLFVGGAGDRRRFLDRLVLALDPAHARRAARYEAAMRQRNRLLAQEERPDPAWLDGLEAQMALEGAGLAQARARTVALLTDRLDRDPADGFPSAQLQLDGEGGEGLAERLRQGRERDRAAGRTLHGPHRDDLVVFHRTKAMPAGRCSTGEQKALLLGIVLAHGELVDEARAQPMLLLLDEVAAHLDPGRRAALFQRLDGRGQVWMTATEPDLFADIGTASRFHVANGHVHRT